MNELMLTKIKTLYWYLKQPKGLQLILNLLKRNTSYKSRENTKAGAERWCAQNAIDTESALKQLFADSNGTYINPKEAFPKEFEYAMHKLNTSPYKMGGGGNLFLLYNACELLQAKYVAETGVAYGWSSLSILVSLVKRKGSLLVSTDMPYAKMGNEAFVGIVVPPELRPNWNLIRESDISGLPKALKSVPYLDLIHYDSDKSYLGRMLSYPKLYEKLRVGGLFVSDDINDNAAFRDFCDRRHIHPTIIFFDNKYVGAFIKSV